MAWFALPESEIVDQFDFFFLLSSSSSLSFTLFNRGEQQKSGQTNSYELHDWLLPNLVFNPIERSVKHHNTKVQSNRPQYRWQRIQMTQNICFYFVNLL